MSFWRTPALRADAAPRPARDRDRHRGREPGVKQAHGRTPHATVTGRTRARVRAPTSNSVCTSRARGMRGHLLREDPGHQSGPMIIPDAYLSFCGA